MQKMVDGQLVAMTLDEVQVRYTESTANEAAQITEYIRAYRALKENGGVTINGVVIQTDVETRANLIGARDLGVPIDWKTENGFITATATDIIAIAEVVGFHVQKCFSAEKIVSAIHTQKPFTSKADVEQAFDKAYQSEDRVKIAE